MKYIIIYRGFDVIVNGYGYRCMLGELFEGFM